MDIAKIQQRIDDEKYDDMSALQKVTLHVLGCKQTLELLLLEMFIVQSIILVFRTSCCSVPTPSNTMRMAPSSLRYEAKDF